MRAVFLWDDMGLFIAIIMFLAAFLLLRSEWEKVQLKTDHYEVRTDKLPEGVSKVRLVFVSDLHDYMPARHTPEMITKAIDLAKPDAVILGGDMITVSKSERVPRPETKTALSVISSIAGKYPVFYGEGNHETRLMEKNPEGYASYVSELFSMGVRYLRDTGAEIPGTGVQVYGVNLSDDFYGRFPGIKKKHEMSERYIEGAIGEADRKNFNVFLIHIPLYLEEAEKAGADLVLSGHYHGGTVRLPDGRGLMTPQYQFFKKECSGEFTYGKAKMIVGRGLGTHSIKIRINDLPQIAVVDITDEGTSKVQN